MLVLAVDTSTPVVTAGVLRVLMPHEILAAAEDSAAAVAGSGGSVAGSGDGPPSPVQALAERTVTDAFGHAEHLMPLVQDALTGAEAGLADLAAIVVGLGPGPFTGLRVGIATAQALGDALSVPVHGIPSHDGLALAATDPSSIDPSSTDRTWADQAAGFLIATDARRREVYLSGYSGGVRRVGPLVAAPADVATQLPDGFTPAWIAGPGAGLLAGALGLPVREIVGSVSRGLVRAALRQLLTGAIPGPLAPLYLRRPDATVPGAPKPVLGPGVTR